MYTSPNVTERLHPAKSTVEDATRVRYELQARRVAGGMVLASVTLGLLVSPYWFGLTAFVGGGLIFAGITGKCPMATLLAKLPGNGPCCSRSTMGH